MPISTLNLSRPKVVASSETDVNVAMLSSPSHGSAMARFDPRHSEDRHHSLTWSLDQLRKLKASFPLTGLFENLLTFKSNFSFKENKFICKCNVSLKWNRFFKFIVNLWIPINICTNLIAALNCCLGMAHLWNIPDTGVPSVVENEVEVTTAVHPLHPKNYLIHLSKVSFHQQVDNPSWSANNRLEKSLWWSGP